jgi:hypothetical protein
VKIQTQVDETITVNTTTEETGKKENQKKKGGWLSWF